MRQMLLAKSMAADGTQHSDIPLPPLRRGRDDELYHN